MYHINLSSKRFVRGLVYFSFIVSITTLALLFCLNSTGYSGDEPFASPEIMEIQSFGTWESVGLRGNYRAILSYSDGSSRLYLQWISEPNYKANRKEFRIEHTLSLPKFNDPNASIYISDLECGYVSGKSFCDISAEDMHSDKKMMIKILLYDEFGKWKEIEEK